MNRIKFLLVVTLSLMMIAGFSVFGIASSFPEKNITIIQPWSAGGVTDTLTRALANIAEQFVNVSILVQNKSGGGGAVPFSFGAQAKPDGYTATITSVEYVIQPLMQEVPYAYDDYRPVMRVFNGPATITVRADAPWNTLEEFLNDARNKPEEFIGSGSPTGASWNMAALALQDKANVKFTWDPSTGMAPAVAQLLGGHIDFVSGSLAEVIPQVEAGNFKILAIFSQERSEDFPDVPTVRESGYDLVLGSWNGIQVPKDTPDDVVNILHNIFKKAYFSEEFAEILDNLSLKPAYMGPEDFAIYINESNKVYKPLVEKFNLKSN